MEAGEEGIRLSIEGTIYAARLVMSPFGFPLAESWSVSGRTLESVCSMCVSCGATSAGSTFQERASDSYRR